MSNIADLIGKYKAKIDENLAEIENVRSLSGRQMIHVENKTLKYVIKDLMELEEGKPRKVKVSGDVAAALDRLSKDNWSKQFDLVSHCKSFSGNGIRVRSHYIQQMEVLNDISPLLFAKILINGYEV
ncbi:hypothetical protein D3C74_49670 [compost metagenome]